MVDYKKQIDGIMAREVSRGEFLKFVGVGLLSFVGVIGFFKHLHEAVPNNSTAKKSGGYGRSPYGR